MSKKGSCYKGFPQFPQGFPQYRSLLWKTDRFWFSAFKIGFCFKIVPFSLEKSLVFLNFFIKSIAKRKKV